MPRDPTLRPLSGFEVGTSLATDLMSTADSLRQLYTDFGLRPYRVFLVWVSYTTDEDHDGLVDVDDQGVHADADTIGAGRPYLLAEIELLPTPRVSVGGVRQNTDAVGRTEVGGATVDQISPAMSEDILQGLMPEFIDPQHPEQLRPGIAFFYEVQEDRPAGFAVQGTVGGEQPTTRRPPRRKFVLDGVPSRSADAFQWRVDLVRADGERGRNGEVEVLP